ncbi:hypothetical protein HN709_01245 [Candidatus Peregrinibacteria bacterium]|jgi:glycerophosphoryl diester phosphodiesterase|nr:hypothetical protein [Candidatus Peregrinibacteria bacterium]MBT7736289.1 hypothetical protein [Candidatus Peregrinibacteria bacterium]
MADDEDLTKEQGDELSKSTEALGGAIGIKQEQRKIKSDAIEKRGVMGKILEGAQARIEVKDELEEKLDKKGFFARIFGEGSKVTMFFTAIADKLGIGKKEDIEFKKFQEEIGEEDIETFIVSHRALGYGRHKENSKEAIEAALDGGEQQLEIDLRVGDDGEIYITHDTIDGIEDPAEKFLPLEDALDVFAQHPSQDIAIFFDVKDPRVLDALDQVIAKKDLEYAGNTNYKPIAEKHFVMGFNHEVIAKAHEKNPRRPLMFNYIPTALLKDSVAEFDKYDRDDIESICSTVDSFAGTHLEDDLKTTTINLHGRELRPPGETPKIENIIHVVEELPNIEIGNPPQDILDVVKYVCIPAPLATKALVNKIRARGVKVAVWGAEGKHIQKAIGSVKADLVISDKPDVIEGNQQFNV